MEFKMHNEDGSEFTVTNTHHALERFQLRFSILYVNIFTKSSRETNLIYTVKCGDGFEDFNTIKDNVRLRKALKKRDYENKKFYFD